MGLFNEFEKNNNSSPTAQNLIRQAPYLTNREKNSLRANATRLKQNNIQARIQRMVGNKLKAANLSKMKISPLQLGVFNGMVNVDAKAGNYAVNVTEILYKKPIKRRPIARGSDFEIEVNAIKLLYGRMQIGAKHTFTVAPNKNAKNRHKYFVAQIDGFTYLGGKKQKLLVKIYTNGKMQVAGGIIDNNSRQPEMIRKFIVDNYASKYKFLYNPIRYYALVGTFQVQGAINLTKVAQAFAKSRNVNYEPELRPALKMTYYGNNFQLFTSGKIQVLGAKTVKSLHDAYNPIGYDLVKTMWIMGMIKPSANTPAAVVKKTTRPKNKAATLTNKNSNIKYLNGQNAIKVGPRKCLTVARPKLVAVAEKMGIVDITSKTTKPAICEKIKDRAFGTFKVGNKPCRAYKKDELVQIAIARGVSVVDSDTVDTLCKKLQMPKAASPKKRGRKPKAAAAPASRTANIAKKLDKRRLTNKAIKEDIKELYGKRWLKKYKNVMPSLNSDVADMKKVINALSLKKNKKNGLPFKTNVNKVKRDTVRTWKFQRQKQLNNKLNNLNNNLAAELEGVMNVATPSPKKNSPKGLNRFPKGTKVEQL
jgi:TATA-box binding protein (TBP) (component of TFIID and TFIIIB)